MRQLLNLSVTPNPGHLLQDWKDCERLVTSLGLDGIEIAPHGDFDKSLVPQHLAKGLHLSFFPILLPFWRQDKASLLSIFGDWHTIEQFYGGRDPSCLVDTYVQQLNLACDLDIPYVVFHPVSCDLAHLFDFKFPWQWQDTLVVSAELLNAATALSRYQGKVLFENLWWPSSFTLDSRKEYDELRQAVNYSNCGICFDTGHMMATNTGLLTEKQGIEFLTKRLTQLDLFDEIETVHLNANLNGQYVESAKRESAPYSNCIDFWHQLDVALKHVSRIDSHSGFCSEPLKPLLDLISPNQVVHELAQPNLDVWQTSLQMQTRLVQPCSMS